MVSLHVGLVLLALGLRLVHHVDLLAHLGHVAVVLLAQSRQGALVGDAHL